MFLHILFDKAVFFNEFQAPKSACETFCTFYYSSTEGSKYQATLQLLKSYNFLVLETISYFCVHGLDGIHRFLLCSCLFC
jgi:hypothetical protein